MSDRVCNRSNYSRTPQGVRGLKWSSIGLIKIPMLSHPARGAWIEIFSIPDEEQARRMSHPARGAWIEMAILLRGAQGDERRTPQGVRGLKFHWMQGVQRGERRTPQGVRGLKCAALQHVARHCVVAPRKGCVD